MKVKDFNSGQRKVVVLCSVSSHIEGRAIQPISRQTCLDFRGRNSEKVVSFLMERRETFQRQEIKVGVKISETDCLGKESKSTNANCNSER